MLLHIIEEVQKCIENECYIAALTLALTIPDICGKAEFPDINGTRERYIRWYDAHVGYTEYSYSLSPYVSGEVVYSLRNMMLHQGTPNIEPGKINDARNKVDKFILTIAEAMDGGASSFVRDYDGTIKNRTLEINITNLCAKLCAVAKGHYAAQPDTFNFFEYELKDKRPGTL